MNYVVDPAAFRRNALIILVLSMLTVLGGNTFLAFTGTLTGAMALLNQGRTPDLIFMLSFLTGVMTIIYLMTVLPYGFILLFSDRDRICDVAVSMLEKYEAYYGISYPGHEGSPSPPPLAYPWNETVSAQRATYYSTGAGAEKAHTTIEVLTKVQALVCGEGADAHILMIAALILLFSFGVLMPLAATTMRLARQARALGGCSECSPGPRRLVYTRMPTPNQQAAQPPQSRGPPVVAVPVNQAASVSVAQPGTSSNLPMAEGKAMV